MKGLSTAMLGTALLAAPAAAQDPSFGSTSWSWQEIEARPTGANGMARSVLRSPTATLDELEMHVTWLPPGKTTHPPHTHPNEELIIVKEGTLEAYQNGKTRRLGPGSIIFEASNEPHNVTNVGDTTAVYHVINWASPGMLAKKAAAAREEIRAFYRSWSEASRARGASGYAASFADDAVLVPPDGPPLLGRASIREWQGRGGAAAAAAMGSGAVREEELQLLGERALCRTTLRAERLAEGGAAETLVARYLDVLRRRPEGGWELTHRMWSAVVEPVL